MINAQNMRIFLNFECPPPPPAETKPRIVSMVPVKNCCEATEAWLIALCTRVGHALYTSWYMYAVYAPVRYLPPTQRHERRDQPKSSGRMNIQQGLEEPFLFKEIDKNLV